MNEATKLLIGALIRNLLVYLGGILVANGYLTKEQWGAVDLTPLVLGILAFLSGLAWSIYQKLRARIALRTALQMSPHASDKDVYNAAATIPTKCAFKS